MTQVFAFQALSKDQLLQLINVQHLEIEAHLATNKDFALELDLMTSVLPPDMAGCLSGAKSDWSGINDRIRFASGRFIKKMIKDAGSLHGLNEKDVVGEKVKSA